MHNLKNISLKIPHNELTVISGVSGSGKSSLAFDTIFAEGQRRYVESLSPYMRQFLGQKPPAEVDEIIGLAPAISIDQKALSHNPRSTVGTLTDIYDYLRVLYARLGQVFCPKCGHKIQKLSLEEMFDIALKTAQADGSKYLSLISPLVRGRKGEYYQLLYDYLSLGYSQIRIDGQIYSLRDQISLNPKKEHNIDLIVDQVEIGDHSRLFEALENALAYSRGLVYVKTERSAEFLLSSNWTCPNDNFSFPEVEARLFSFNSPHGSCPSCFGLGRVGFQADNICPKCQGQRLRPEALAVRIEGKNIAELSALSLKQAWQFFNDLLEKLNDRQLSIVSAPMQQIIDRLAFLNQVGVSYLSLKREAETLSGGEAQRIRLSSQIGSQLSRTLYVLDEPTIGLHESDTQKLIQTLKTLRDKGNTLILVEHDEQFIKQSDFLVDLGPAAGISGGQVVAIGPTKDLLASNQKEEANPDSLTLDYLSGRKKIPVPNRRRRSDKGYLSIKGARANNLKNINLEIPLGRLLAFCGVSGSGKSSLLYDVLYKNIVRIKNDPGRKKNLLDVSEIKGVEHINKAVIIDQSPIGRTPRSNPATYTGLFTPIRDFFASLPAAKERAYSLSRFSFNRSGGRCEACQGAGFKLIEMHFLPPVLVECEICRGRRFNRETLQVEYKGYNIADILDLSVSEALDLFEANYHITDKLNVLKSVGLSYLKLGQSATTLSGGEAQRIKIARELAYISNQKTLYLLDEPTTGLHYHDIGLLLQVLNRLVDKGNSVVLIEHNMQVLKSMDYLIDLGPSGGEEGGYLLAAGEPEDLVREEKSLTGRYLKDYLK